MNASEFLRAKDGSLTLFDLTLLAAKNIGVRIPDRIFFEQNILPSDQDAAESSSEAIEPNLPLHVSASLLSDALKAFVAIASVDVGRTSLLTLCPQLPVVIVRLLSFSFSPNVPMGTVQADCIEVISRSCDEPQLQTVFVQAGAHYFYHYH